MTDENKKFYKTLVVLCIPIIIQNLISTLINMVDTVMVGSLGEVSVAAIGIANQYFFLFTMALSGIIGGAGIFMAQFYGKGDKDSIKKVTALSVIAALILGLIFFVIAVFFPEVIIHLFSYDSAVVKEAKSYFLVIGFCYPIMAVSYIFSMGSRNVMNPRLGMTCSFISLVVNIILNYVFIFGKFGAPALGVKGAAVATVIARIIEFILLIGYVYFIRDDYELRFGFKDIRGITKDLVSTVVRKSAPTFLNDVTWAFGSVMYSVAYATAGTSAIAASQIAGTTGNFFVMTANCIAIGSAIMLGNELGANNIEKAIKYAKKFAVIITVVGVILGMLLIICTPVLLKIFSVSDSLAPDLRKIFIIMGVMMGLRTLDTFIVIGVLRSGGDTKYALFLEMGCMWLASIPMTFFAAHKGAPIYMLVAFTYIEEIGKFVFGAPRALSKKWANNIVKDM